MRFSNILLSVLGLCAVNAKSDLLKFLDKNIDYEKMVRLHNQENVSISDVGLTMNGLCQYALNLEYIENKNSTDIENLKNQIVEHVDKELTLAESKLSKDENDLERRALGLCCSTWRAVACYTAMGGMIPACMAGGPAGCAGMNIGIITACTGCFADEGCQ